MKTFFILVAVSFLMVNEKALGLSLKEGYEQISQLNALTADLAPKIKAFNQFRAASTPFACQVRITLQANTPIPTTNQSAVSTLRVTPYQGNRVSLYNGTIWQSFIMSSEVTLALSGLTSGANYDVFLYDNSGTLTIELTQWTNDTTRATALTTQDGVYVRTGATTRRYLGTIRTSSTTTTEDTSSQRYVWNYYNRVPRLLSRNETTNTWQYGTATWRQVNATAANVVEMVIGVRETLLRLRGMLTANNGSANRANVGPSFGVATTSTITNALRGGVAGTPGITQLWTEIKEFPGIGYRAYFWNEIGVSTVPDENFYGDNGDARLSSGVLGYIEG